MWLKKGKQRKPKPTQHCRVLLSHRRHPELNRREAQRHLGVAESPGQSARGRSAPSAPPLRARAGLGARPLAPWGHSHGPLSTCTWSPWANCPELRRNGKWKNEHRDHPPSTNTAGGRKATLRNRGGRAPHQVAQPLDREPWQTYPCRAAPSKPRPQRPLPAARPRLTAGNSCRDKVRTERRPREASEDHSSQGDKRTANAPLLNSFCQYAGMSKPDSPFRCLWEKYSISLSLSFLIYEMGQVALLTFLT